MYIVRYLFALQLRSNPNFYSKQTQSLLRFQKTYTNNGKILSTRLYFAHFDGSKEKRDEHKHSFLTKYYLKLGERFNEGFTNKPAKHFKAQGKREAQSFGIYKLTHWLATDAFCLLWVSKAPYVSRNKYQCKNRDKKALWTQGFEFLSVRKKVRPSAGKDQKF